MKGKLLYRRMPRAGSSDDKSPIVFFDLEEREEKRPRRRGRLRADVRRQEDARRLHKKQFAILEIKEKQKFEKPIATADIEAPVDPRAEWRQMFNDVWRFERDFFYDPDMHGVDWAAMGRATESCSTTR